MSTSACAARRSFIQIARPAGRSLTRHRDAIRSQEHGRYGRIAFAARRCRLKFGRKPKLSDYQRKEAIKRRAAGESLAEIAKSYAVDLSMISRLS
jgi:hypothetical protein